MTWRWSAVAGGALLVLAALAYGRALGLRPLDADNLIALSIADRPSPSFLADNFVTFVPGYRPLAYMTLWGQYQLLGDGTGHLFAFNLLAAVAAALGVYAIVVAATSARLIAVLPAAALLLDLRLAYSQVWLGERQSTLACALGAGAFALAVPALRAPLSSRRIAGIAVVILAACACKEFGIAFASGVAVIALLGPPQRRVALLAAAIGPVLLYLIARAALAGASLEGFCETMGYPGRPVREVCYGDLGLGERLAQHAWNVVATFVGTFLAPLLDEDGGPLPPGQIPLRALLVPLVVLALAVAGFRLRPRVVSALLVVVAVNAVLNLALYRDRNQLAGTLALDAAAGIGLVALARAVAPRPAARILTGVAACAILAWLATQVSARHDDIDSARASFGAREPCEALAAFPDDVDRAVVRTVKLRYGLSDPECSAQP